MSRLLLGRVVGHTDHISTTIWIRAMDDRSDYELRVQGRGLFPFVGTETGQTNSAPRSPLPMTCDPIGEHRYRIVRRGRARNRCGRQFPHNAAAALFADVLLRLTQLQPRQGLGCLATPGPLHQRQTTISAIMMGDQVYVDEKGATTPNVWKEHLDSKLAVRRQALAAEAPRAAGRASRAARYLPKPDLHDVGRPRNQEWLGLVCSG